MIVLELWAFLSRITVELSLQSRPARSYLQVSSSVWVAAGGGARSSGIRGREGWERRNGGLIIH